MTGKRDKKGRVLRQGERQRKDGRYEYRYKDAHGETRSVYSWRLVESDSTPKGKKDGKPLRELEKGIIRDLEDNVNSYTAYRTTLNSFYDAYIETKYELKQSTRTNYKYMYGKYVRDEIGMKNVAEIKYSDIKRFYIHLINDVGFKPNSMEIIHTILHPVFNVAVRDGFIRSNPTDGVMAEIKKSHNWEKPKRHALTEPQQERFIEFISESSTYCHWKPLFTVLLGTGARIGEVLGLRWEDCDFKQNIIDINHNLIYRQQDSGKMELHITTPKTKAGTRIVPMFADVRTALLQVRQRQAESGFNQCVVDGYSNFVFHNRYGEMLTPHAVNRVIDRIIRDCNLEETEQAKQEQREPVLLPHFSVHNLRHTFCTRLCENEPNLKIIQEIMGHRNIETTMDVYNEATKERKVASFASLEGKIKIS